jgi:hypothetical protein
MSSALVLYRLMCLFPGSPIDYGDGYKSVWSVYLRNPTNNVEIYDYKGGFSMRCRRNNEDVQELLAVLLHPECPHPYDGVIAGKVG